MNVSTDGPLFVNVPALDDTHVVEKVAQIT
jgi:hypothetical protein